MSGSMNPIPGIDELRRRFAIWSLAIFGSLSGSGSVQLESSAWGAEDPPTEANAQTDKKPVADAAAEFDRAAFQQLVQGKNFEAAAKMIDEALTSDPSANNLYMNFMLANAMLNADAEGAMARMETVAKQTTVALAESPSPQVNIAFAMSHQAMAGQLVKDKQVAQAIELLSDAVKKLEAKQASQSSSLISMMVSLLMREGKVDEAKALASQRLETALATLKETSSSSNRSSLASAFSQFNSVIGSKFPEEVQKAYDTIEPMLREAVEAEAGSIGDYSAYQAIQTSFAMSKADTDAAGATKMLQATKELGDKLAERLDPSAINQISNVQAMLKSVESRIQAKLLHQSLIGQPAPEFEIESVVNMPKVSWPELKGKVVLIDFWAVWCGPCIATFPHLQQWNKELGPKGLVIVGVTRQYGYKWDKEKGRQVTAKDATLEEELEMLEEFRKAHELEHGFVVTPKESEYNRKFGVTGIPQAVLVDQNGVIQMIRVGSGEKNAEELEARIRSLLGV